MEKHTYQNNRTEAKKVSIYEYDEEKVMRMMREEAREDGWEEGLQLGMERGIEQKLKELIGKKLAKGKTPEEIADILEEPLELVQVLARKLAEEKK